MGEEQLNNSVSSPLGELFVNTVPFPYVSGKSRHCPPLRAYHKTPSKKTAAVRFVAGVGTRFLGQNRINLLPLVVCKGYCRRKPAKQLWY